jgi:hypothetical protein
MQIVNHETDPVVDEVQFSGKRIPAPLIAEIASGPSSPGEDLAFLRLIPVGDLSFGIFNTPPLLLN